MGHHPLECHLLDVLAVAECLWDQVVDSPTRDWVATDLGLPPSETGRWVAALAGLHDLGKASPAFQLGTLPDPDGGHRASLDGSRLTVDGVPARAMHGTLAALPLRDVLTEEHGLQRSVAADLGLVLAGHHGVFPSAKEARTQAGAAGTGTWDEARRAISEQVIRMAGIHAADPRPSGVTPRVAMYLAGLVSVADWIGSNTDHFPYLVGAGMEVSETSLEEYLYAAREQANGALDQLGWRNAPTEKAAVTFEDAFGMEPRPLQTQVAALAAALVV